MKYRNLNLTFAMEDVTFTVLSISNEQMLVPIPRHSHSRNSYELHYISYGYGTLIADDAKYDLTPGVFFMTGPQVFHEQISDPVDPMREYGVYLKVSLPRRGTKSEVLRRFLKTPFYIGQADLEVYELMKKLIAELEQSPEGEQLMLSAILQQLIVEIARLYQKTSPEAGRTDSAAGAHSPDDQTYLVIEEAFLYNYHDLTLDGLAALVNLSPRQTERLLQQHYNKTFLQKKKEARMSAACILLQSKEKSIAAIAEELGYSSPEHFTHAFCALYRMTPSQYRKTVG
ncbi:MAG: helix-turn-helix domain-containing protein [Lachnospiraceae bacterium]|nr:helix-turn-helix domain-containing protein [Lachnospiraceae bacterium]MBO4788491.1 helix-turn-helix domain-containing protein [Lachnospiraceae bacterium]